MKRQELIDFLDSIDMTTKEMSLVLGVSKQAVDNWVEGRREIPETTARIIKLFMEDDKMIDKFLELGGVM